MTYHWTESGPVSTVELAEMITADLAHLDHDDPAAEAQRDLLEELRREYPEDFPRKKAVGIFINCRRAQFIDEILARAKVYETRTRKMLHSLIGQRVYLIETGTGPRAKIRGSAVISGAVLVQFDDVAARKAAGIYGTPYDIKPGSTKWFYRLSAVRALKRPVPVPDQRENHGRAWTNWEK